jgi:hypothetical protein
MLTQVMLFFKQKGTSTAASFKKEKKARSYNVVIT